MSGFVAVDPTEIARFGEKGVMLSRLRALGAPVPPSFTLAVELGRFLGEGQPFPVSARQAIREAMGALEAATGRTFGGSERPLLVSVRSGAPFSMPGMLDTILNVGLSPSTADALVAEGHPPRFARDCELHLLRSYGEAVMFRRHPSTTLSFSSMARGVRRTSGLWTTGQLDDAHLIEVRAMYVSIYQDLGEPLPPTDPWAQLEEAVRAVYLSWDSERARQWREEKSLPVDAGTAVTIMPMVFGNLDESSASGVVLSRDPGTGAAEIYGEYLPRSQGDELAAGHGTPAPFGRAQSAPSGESLEARLPAAHAALAAEATRLERALRFPVELEFTVESGRAYVLQARRAKLSARGAVRAAVELLEAGALTPAEAVALVEPDELGLVVRPKVAHGDTRLLLARGLPASPGATTGRVVFSTLEAERRQARGESVILVRPETSPQDVKGIRFAAAIVTARGGTTSHAAVVARALGKTCVVGARELDIDPTRKILRARGVTIHEGDVLTVDGRSGEIFRGTLATVSDGEAPEVDRLLAVADTLRQLRVDALVGSIDEVRAARANGADGFVELTEERLGRPELEPRVAAAEGRPLLLTMPKLDGTVESLRVGLLTELARRSPIELALTAPGDELRARVGRLRAQLDPSARVALGVLVSSEEELSQALAALDRLSFLLVDLETAAKRLTAPPGRRPQALRSGALGRLLASAAEAARGSGLRAHVAGRVAAEPDAIRYLGELGFRGVVVPVDALARARLAAAQRPAGSGR